METCFFIGEAYAWVGLGWQARARKEAENSPRVGVVKTEKMF